MTWQTPFPSKKITCAHGVVDRLHPNGHRGTDYGLPVGTKIPMIAPTGVVVKSEWSKNLGNVTVVKLPVGGKFWYSVHMQHPGLPVGTKVRFGDTVGKVGDTGAYCFGAHLHTGISDTVDGVYSGKVYDIVEFVAEQNKKAAAPAVKVAASAEAAEVVSKPAVSKTVSAAKKSVKK